MLKLAAALFVTTFVSWVGWAVYNLFHAAEPITTGYAIASAATILGPLVIGLAILMRCDR